MMMIMTRDSPVFFIALLQSFHYKGTFIHRALQDVTLCEHQSKEIKCSFQQQITILSAVYGRENQIDCRGGFYGDTHCNDGGAMAKTQAHCNDKDKCTLYASNSFYGDPCRGVRKYLHVTYFCKWLV